MQPYSPADWVDVVPLPQVEPAGVLFSIAYDSTYAEVFGYLRAVLASGERSPRVLSLTGAALELGPSHYTAWHVRRESLPDDAGALRAELEWVGALVDRRSAWKNYQVWHHRRLLAERLRDSAQEVAFTTLALDADEKNYHAWSHRQWALLSFDAGAAPWAAERAFAAGLIDKDVHNNSAWNHRWFALTRGGGAPHAVAPQLRPPAAEVAAEAAAALAALRAAPRNEAAWSHLRALVQLAAGGGVGQMLSSPRGGEAWAAWPEALAFCEEQRGAAAAAGTPNAFALEALAEVAEARGAAAEAAALFEEAAAGDAVRESYWRSRADAARVPPEPSK